MGHRYPRSRPTSISFLLVTATLMGSALPASASLSSDSAIGRFSDTNPTPSTVLQDAHALARAGDFGGARKHYALAARMQRAAGILPEEAMWHLAQMYHGEGRIRKAAMTLEHLAWEAALAGDPELQARALLEATVLYGQVDDADEVEQGLRRLDDLRAATQVPSELRMEIGRRLNLPA